MQVPRCSDGSTPPLDRRMLSCVFEAWLFLSGSFFPGTILSLLFSSTNIPMVLLNTVPLDHLAACSWAISQPVTSQTPACL